ncbi:hypothetical protein NDU88_005710 [Pleurodeles waltl]|uniref:Uncharacterized protein n=1 Tax=Pleurodeles waltl TaxID=8319 RepID=A0AAV7WYM6_PLEWA|nr:hypothetical protein NDU88_005710 [Pleurodeles waltl]
MGARSLLCPAGGFQVATVPQASAVISFAAYPAVWDWWYESNSAAATGPEGEEVRGTSVPGPPCRIEVRDLDMGEASLPRLFTSNDWPDDMKSEGTHDFLPGTAMHSTTHRKKCQSEGKS